MEISKEWDVIIVGAGILGMATARSLLESEPHLSILVIDKYPAAGQGNTSKSNAAYRNVFGTKTNVLLSNSSISFYKYLQTEADIDLELREFGYLWLLSEKQYQARNDPIIRGEERSLSFLEFLDRYHIEYQILQSDQLKEGIPNLDLKPEDDFIDPPPITHGLWGKQCGTLSPDLLVKAYEELFLTLGGNVLYECLAKRIVLKERGKPFDEDYEPSIWRNSEAAGLEIKHQGKSGYLRGKKVILTTGAWINQLLDPLGVHSTIKPKKRQLFRLCNMEELVRTSYFRSSSIPFLILPVGGVFIKPIAAANCVDVGCSDEIGRRFESTNATKDVSHSDPFLDDPRGEMDFYIMNLFPVLNQYFPTVFTSNTKVQRPSAGMYAYSLDKNPVIERVKQLGNLYFCSGASGSGIMKADAIGRITAALCMDRKNAELYGGSKVKVGDFSLRSRNLERETMIL